VAHRLEEGRKTSTVARNVGAIVNAHRSRKFKPPATDEARSLLRGARRLRAEHLRTVRPLSLADLRAIVAPPDGASDLRAVRDRTIVLIGFASSLRTANLSSLQLNDVEFSDQGATLRIGREKQDQEGKGRLIGLPYGKHPETCPVGALRSWIAQRGQFPGPLFIRLCNNQPIEKPMQPERIGQIVQQCVARIGLNWREYGGHSLRAGFVTAAGEAGIGELLIAAQTGHHDMATLRRYFRRTDVFRANACGLLDL
jgi:integrase